MIGAPQELSSSSNLFSMAKQAEAGELETVEEEEGMEGEVREGEAKGEEVKGQVEVRLEEDWDWDWEEVEILQQRAAAKVVNALLYGGLVWEENWIPVGAVVGVVVAVGETVVGEPVGAVVGETVVGEPVGETVGEAVGPKSPFDRNEYNTIEMMLQGFLLDADKEAGGTFGSREGHTSPILKPAKRGKRGSQHTAGAATPGGDCAGGEAEGTAEGGSEGETVWVRLTRAEQQQATKKGGVRWEPSIFGRRVTPKGGTSEEPLLVRLTRAAGNWTAYVLPAAGADAGGQIDDMILLRLTLGKGCWEPRVLSSTGTSSSRETVLLRLVWAGQPVGWKLRVVGSEDSAGKRGAQSIVAVGEAVVGEPVGAVVAVGEAVVGEPVGAVVGEPVGMTVSGTVGGDVGDIVGDVVNRCRGLTTVVVVGVLRNSAGKL
eukprot:gene8673-10290_t